MDAEKWAFMKQELERLRPDAWKPQPLGFTREDVEELRSTAVGFDDEAGAMKRVTALTSLADRIEALLPPE